MEQLKIMLVDDEERFLATTKKLLAKKGHDILTATSGSEALNILKTKKVHVVILDVKMPGMNGLATLRQIKKLYPMVEVIMLTGHATGETAVDVLNAGATDCLMKPVDIDDLVQKVEEASEKRQGLEAKIRAAQTGSTVKPPRSISGETR
ncbi:MAG: response regulator [Candidatus Desulfaltia sp.]|nr:response regulator [Candidatus Desulfaltia sp.]